MIIFLRGHIRNSFVDTRLYNLLKDISKQIQPIKIYIQTWNIIASNLSWRQVKEDPTPVTEAMIYAYFKDLSRFIEHILILDDTKAELVGSTEGKICNSPCPKLGWKYMWYGKLKGLESIKDKNEPILNLRFDIFNNSNPGRNTQILNFVINNKFKTEFEKIYFIADSEYFGVDNIYLGCYDKMYKLISHFHNKLDFILSKYPSICNQEYLVFRENNFLFPK